MLCRVVLCRVSPSCLCFDAFRQALLRGAVLCGARLCCAVLCRARLCCAMLCCAVACCAVPCCPILSRVVLAARPDSEVGRSNSGSTLAPKWAHAGVTNQRSPPKPQGACRTRSSLLLPRAVCGVSAVVQVQRASAPRPSLEGPVGREARHIRFVGSRAGGTSYRDEAT